MHVPSDGNVRQMTALVKGSGPSGLSAAIALAQEGFQVTVAEKRPFRAAGEGRKNMVAIRPEALHQLELLGGLDDARSKDTLTPITQAATHNEWDDSTFVWPLDTQPRYGKPEDWESPAKLDDNVPSTFINLGHLEDHLVQAAEKLGVKIRYNSTFELQPLGDQSERYIAVWISDQVQDQDGSNGTEPLPSTSYDLIVCASGKNDLSLERCLKFRRHIGVKLESENLPSLDSRQLRLGPEHEIETQRYLVFGLRSSKLGGTLGHDVRKRNTGSPEQPIVEIEMRHAAASHYILQIPRGFQESRDRLDAYVTQRVNARQAASFANVAQMQREGVVVWGDPLTPIRVETSTAPTYVFGSNVVLVGDAGCSCSPTGGLGADIGLTHDGQTMRVLARELKDAQKQQTNSSTDISVNGKAKDYLYSSKPWQQALDNFNLSKAKGAVMWSKGSRWFYLTSEKANDILESIKQVEVAA